MIFKLCVYETDFQSLVTEIPFTLLIGKYTNFQGQGLIGPRD